MTSMGLAGVAGATAEAKIRLPLQRNGLVRRARLLERLAAVPDDVPLVLLTAPAGYGKTTVLSQWAEADQRPFGWVTLDRADADPVRLAGHVALALHDIQALDPAVFRALGSGDGGGYLEALSQLLAALNRRPEPGVLVLDDVHEVRSVEALNVVRVLAAGVPRGFHIAIASRLGLGMGRLRSEGRSVEFGPEDLAFAADEAREVLAGVGVVLAEKGVAAVVRRTEGWPTGVYLSALAIRAEPEAADEASGPRGDDPFIVDYLRDELLARESPETVRFLLRTAPLEQMSGALCDHVLGGNESAGRLADAARRSLFIVPLDRRGEWYRYHGLVSQMLLSELRRRDPGEEQRVHLQAAEWYEQRGRPEDAISHAIRSQDGPTVARLVNRHAREFVAAGRLRTVRDWLDALHDDALVTYPPVAITAGWIMALQGDPLSAHRFLHAAEGGSFDGSLPDGSTSLASASTLLRAAMGALGVERMLLDATAAVNLERPGSPWHPAAMTMLGIAHLLTGDTDLAVKELDLASRLGGQGQKLAASAALAELSLLAARRGDWNGAEREAGRALDMMVSGGIQEQAFAVLGYTAAARVAAHSGDQARARHHIGTALRLCASPSPEAFPWMFVQVALDLSHCLLDLGDYEAARFRAEQARSRLTRLLTEGTLAGQLTELSARLARVGDQVGLPSAMTLTTAEMRVLRLLPTQLTLEEIGGQLYTSRNTVKSQVAAIYRKLGGSSRTEVVGRGRDAGLLTPQPRTPPATGLAP